MIENFIDRNKDGKADGGYHGILSLVDAIETEKLLWLTTILSQAPFRITRRASREQVTIVREFVWLQMLNHGMKTGGSQSPMLMPFMGTEWEVGVLTTPHRRPDQDRLGGDQPQIQGRTDDSKLGTLSRSRNAGWNPGGLARSKHNGRPEGPRPVLILIDADRIQVLVNGRQEKNLNFTRKTHPTLFSDGVVKFDRTIPVSLSADAHLIVVAYGENFDLKSWNQWPVRSKALCLQQPDLRGFGREWIHP